MNGNVFVGRKHYLAQIGDVLQALPGSDLDDAPKFILITGTGGIGKTKIAERIRVIASSLGLRSSVVIDLLETENRSDLSVLAALARSLDPDEFSTFFEAILQYREAEDLDRANQYDRALNAFITSCRTLSEKRPLVILLDTFESVLDTGIATRLITLANKLSGRCAIVIAGREISINQQRHALALQLQPFDLEESKELAQRLYQARNIACDLGGAEISGIHKLAKGQPILVTLAIEWILENARPEDILSLQIEQFEKQMVLRIRELKSEESQAILLMSVANRRLDAKILSLLTGWEADKSKRVYENLKRFSFVKVRQDGLVSTLHDEMLRLIKKYIGLPSETEAEYLQVLVDKYYSLEIPEAPDMLLRRILTAERIYYRLVYQPQIAIQEFDIEMQTAIQAFDFDFCNLLLNEMNKQFLPSSLSRTVDLCRAEYALKTYRPLEAEIVLQRLRLQFDPDSETEEYCRILEGLGAAITNPCTIAKADPFEAIDLWNMSLDICKRKRLNHRIPRIEFLLGETYRVIGQHVDAERMFRLALKGAKKQFDMKLMARILDELGKLYRHQQNVPKAFKPLQESQKIRLSIGDSKNLGLSYYYLGNAFRDLDQFDKAHDYYSRAESALTEINDEFVLCMLYSDIAWIARLEEDYIKAMQFSERSYEIAVRREFGTELSEHWHIAYEVAMAQGNAPEAYRYLDKALEYAYKYTNIYMILDCQNHAAQRAYKARDYMQVHRIVDEMLSWEERGCGIRVFRGRAMMVLGNVLFDNNAFYEALSVWTEGLTIIAHYGNSRTNVELFADIFEQNKTKIAEALMTLGPSSILRLRVHWRSEGLHLMYSDVEEMCKQLRETTGQDRNRSD